MTTKISIQTLLAHDPCSDSKAFIKKHKSSKTLWLKCERADWMIWALSKFYLLTDDLAREFACDCAEHTLHFFEDKYPEDKRPRLAIEASRRTLTDKSAEALSAWDAARAAAWDAARAAAGDAAWAAAGAAAWDAARDAAWDAARAAAGAAAWDAARDATRAAAWAAENKWQANRLRQLIDPFKRKA